MVIDDEPDKALQALAEERRGRLKEDGARVVRRSDDGDDGWGLREAPARGGGGVEEELMRGGAVRREWVVVEVDACVLVVDGERRRRELEASADAGTASGTADETRVIPEPRSLASVEAVFGSERELLPQPPRFFPRAGPRLGARLGSVEPPGVPCKGGLDDNDEGDERDDGLSSPAPALAGKGDWRG